MLRLGHGTVARSQLGLTHMTSLLHTDPLEEGSTYGDAGRNRRRGLSRMWRRQALRSADPPNRSCRKINVSGGRCYRCSTSPRGRLLSAAGRPRPSRNIWTKRGRVDRTSGTVHGGGSVNVSPDDGRLTMGKPVLHRNDTKMESGKRMSYKMVSDTSKKLGILRRASEKLRLLKCVIEG